MDSMESVDGKGSALQNNEQKPASDFAGKRSVLIWGWPTRVFHWALVVLVTTSFVTGNIGGNAMRYHLWSGFTILGLLIFRLVWGFVGSRYARFSSFVRGPAAAWHYARSLMHPDHPGHLGHNPLGGWSIIAMLLALLLQVVSGLFATDEIFTQGPLYPLVSDSTADWLTGIHVFNQWVIVSLIVLHLTAVLFYLTVKHDNLITPMITGVKPWHAATEAPSDAPNTGMALIVAALSAAAVVFIVR
jgi:cytochrome b